MSRLARRRGHEGSCPTRLGRGAIRGAAKKQTPTRVPRRASLAFGVRALVMQDGEIAARGWRAICRRARRETHLGGRGDGGLRREHLGGRRHGGAEGQGRGHRVCVCTDATVCPPSPRGAFVARTRDAPLAWPRGSSLLVDAIHLGVGGRDRETFSGSGLFKPRTTSQGVETEPKRRYSDGKSRIPRRPGRCLVLFSPVLVFFSMPFWNSPHLSPLAIREPRGVTRRTSDVDLETRGFSAKRRPHVSERVFRPPRVPGTSRALRVAVSKGGGRAKKTHRAIKPSTDGSGIRRGKRCSGKTPDPRPRGVTRQMSDADLETRSFSAGW
jgi:hypothetical protein